MYLIESKKCPYCDAPLEKEPKRKKVCEKCKNIYFVRTRPDRKRVVVTEKEIEIIEQQWHEDHIRKYGDQGNYDYKPKAYKPKIKRLIDYSSIDPYKFITIDFETANENRCSICSMGIAIVENFNIIDKKHWLIKPQELRFNKYNVKKHGITEDMVINEPEFDELWGSIKNYFNSNIVFCHNINFDIYALKDVLQNYNLEFPTFYYQDSMQIAKVIWNDLPNYRLKTLAEKFNIKTNFHDACDDAICCSKIIIESCKEHNVYNITDLLKKIKFNLRPFPPEPGVY